MSPALERVLGRQQARGLLGPDPIPTLRGHSLLFAAALPHEPERVVDLGSGGGVPGLVLAVEAWPRAQFVLVDGNQRRCTYLELAVAELGLAARVVVQWGRAEEIGRQEARRGWADVVVARSFGPAAVTAECAAPLLRSPGWLVVSEPPGGAPDRWDGDALALLGLEWEATVTAEGHHFARLRQVRPCPEAYPRRPGRPTQKPLF